MGRLVIKDCRDIFEASRRSSLADKSNRKLSPPPWLDERHPLWPIVAEQDILYDGGQVVWGAIATANDLLYDPGPQDTLAALVYAAGTAYDESPAFLQDVAKATRELSVESEDSEVRKFAAFLDDPKSRALRIPIPASLIEDTPLFYAMVLVPRRHLPNGVLTKHLLPVVVNSFKTAAAAILPSCYWSPEMLDYWTDF